MPLSVSMKAFQITILRPTGILHLLGDKASFFRSLFEFSSSRARHPTQANVTLFSDVLRHSPACQQLAVNSFGIKGP